MPTTAVRATRSRFLTGSLRAKLVLLFLFVSLVPLVAVGLLAYTQANSALSDQATSKLVALRGLKAGQIEEYFASRLNDSRVLSSNPTTAAAVNAFCQGCHIDAASAGLSEPQAFDAYRTLYLGQPTLADAGDGSRYSAAHAEYHPIFKEFIEAYGYSDLYLVDTHHGKIIYSIAKKDDFGTHLTQGAYAGTNISAAFQKAAQSTAKGFTALEDFAFY